MVGGYLCSMEQYQVGSTVRCVFKACFTALRKKQFFGDQSCAQSAGNVIGNDAAWTTFLPLEPAVSSEGSIKCSDFVSDAFLSSAIVR